MTIGSERQATRFINRTDTESACFSRFHHIYSASCSLLPSTSLLFSVETLGSCQLFPPWLLAGDHDAPKSPNKLDSTNDQQMRTMHSYFSHNIAYRGLLAGKLCLSASESSVRKSPLPLVYRQHNIRLKAAAWCNHCIFLFRQI